METDQEKKLKAALAELPNAESESDFLRLAIKTDEGFFKSSEYNFWASILISCDASVQEEQPLNLASIHRTAEQGIMQQALHNHGLQPPCSFIIKAHEAGWRFDNKNGFIRI